MKKNFFEFEAEKHLSLIAEKLENNEDIEVNLQDGILTIKAKNGDYAINKHLATEKIWFSSPVSNLKYFSLKDGKFVDEKSGIELEEALLKDLANI